MNIKFLILNLFICANFYAQGSDNDTLHFLGNKNIAPVIYFEDSIPSGVVVDIVLAIAKHISQPIEIRAMDWQEAQILVAQGEADALMQINQTEERLKIYDFSDPLLESQFSIFVHTDRVGISGISSLRGLRVGVESGGLPQQLLEKNPHIPLTIIPDFLEGFKMMNEGTIDAIVVDYRVGSYILAKYNIRNIQVSGEPIAFSYSSFAVKKGNTKLLQAINNALRIIKADGTYQNIINKWKPKEVVFHTREQIKRMVYNITIPALLLLFLIVVIWMATLKKELSKRKTVEVRLREEHTTLRSIINSANAIIFSVDRQYCYTSFNQQHAATMNALYRVEIKLGSSTLDYMTVPEDRETAIRNLDRVLAGEQLVEESYSGEELRLRRYFQVSHSPIKSGEEIIGVTVLAQDITERKQAEEELQRLNRELRAITNCNQVLVRTDDERELLNDICHIISEEAGYCLVWVGYAEHDDAKTVRPVAWAGFDNGYIANANLSWSASTERGRGPGGESIRSGKIVYIQDFTTDERMSSWRENAWQRGYHSVISLPLKDENANVFGVLLIYSTKINAFTPDELRFLDELAGDLAYGIVALRARTERRQAEVALHAASLYARSLIEASLDPLVTISADGKITDVNKATESVTGFTRERLIYSDFSDYFTEHEKARDGYQQVLAQGLVRDYPLTIRHTSGKTTDVLYNATVYKNESGEIQGVFAAARDITKSKQAEAEIKLKNEQLFELNATKDKFFSIIAHDLRGPFSGFLGLTEIMMNELDSLTMKEIKAFSVSMRNSAANMFCLLENLLQWSKMQQGSIPFNPELLQLLQVVDECITMVIEQAKNKGIEITYDVPDDLKVFADSNILQTIIRNLVSNALKFTPKGGKISVSAKATGDKGIEISVKDTGIGMTSEMVNNLFRLDVKTNRKGTDGEPSSGLGLLLYKEFVEKLGGKIRVESEEGKGSTFYFTIP